MPPGISGMQTEARRDGPPISKWLVGDISKIVNRLQGAAGNKCTERIFHVRWKESQGP